MDNALRVGQTASQREQGNWEPCRCFDSRWCLTLEVFLWV